MAVALRAATSRNPSALCRDAAAMTTASSPSTVIHQLSIRDLLALADAVCARRGVTRHELCGRGRTRAVAAARHELWWLIRHHPERRYSYSEIARIVGFDHATILQGVTAHQRLFAPLPPP
jgi:chromosomal replication initiation ATPase DnaA